MLWNEIEVVVARRHEHAAGRGSVHFQTVNPVSCEFHLNEEIKVSRLLLPLMGSHGPGPAVRQPQPSRGMCWAQAPRGRSPEEAQSPCTTLPSQLRGRGESPVQAAGGLLPKEAGQQGQRVQRTISRCLNKTRGTGPEEWDGG